MTANSNCSTCDGTFWIWIYLRFYSDHKYFIALIIRCTKYFKCLIFGHYCASKILLTLKFSQTTVLYKIFEISNECLFLRGVYFHWVLINTCNFFVACSCVGTVYFRTKVIFLLIPLQCLVQPEIQSAIDRLLPTPAHQHKVPGANESVRVIPGCFIKRPCINFIFYLVLIACLQSETDTDKK